MTNEEKLQLTNLSEKVDKNIENYERIREIIRNICNAYIALDIGYVSYELTAEERYSVNILNIDLDEIVRVFNEIGMEVYYKAFENKFIVKNYPCKINNKDDVNKLLKITDEPEEHHDKVYNQERLERFLMLESDSFNSIINSKNINIQEIIDKTRYLDLLSSDALLAALYRAGYDVESSYQKYLNFSDSDKDLKEMVDKIKNFIEISHAVNKKILMEQDKSEILDKSYYIRKKS